ncbi:uncharacterized protein LOC118195388 [Stegodyphus dumicola]|uniref:uncharacterized protein LOC118195388 n=1 Tax=Stegodyphus dumicola TaxID=202533 RepID=UPI0015B15C94|nr:uncharacterized protein LOC118195388 [Stegodyphus dumicola]
MHTAFISIDLKSAFDTLWWPAIKQALRGAHCPSNLFNIFNSYLHDRHIQLVNNDGTTSKVQEKGCPQGSCAGPTLWNLTFNSVLETNWPQHTNITAYADDVALLVRGRTRKELERNSTETCTLFTTACNKLKLTISIEKSSAIIIPRRGTNPTRRPCIKLLGRNIKIARNLKYLGVVWDQGLTWIPHIMETRNKTSIIARIARQFQGRNWGQNPHIQKVLYLTVVEKIALYAAVIWAQPMGTRKIRQLTTLQRPFALQLSKAYRTTATSAATVLAGILPLHIKAEMEATFTKLIHLRKDATFANTSYSPVQFERPSTSTHTHPALRGSGTHIKIDKQQTHTSTRAPRNGNQIYTDGSKQENGVGSAFVHYENGKTVHDWQGQLRTHNSIFQAEVLGITAAVQHLIDCQIPRANIYTDSLSTLLALENHHHVSPLILSLQHLLMQHPHYHFNLVWVKAHANNEGNEAADTLAKDAISNPTAQPITVPAPCSYLKGLLREQGMHQWQREWTECETGRRTFTYLPKVSADRLFAVAPLTYFITGHGPFPSYYNRHGISNTDICVCGTEGSPDHYVFECPLTAAHHLPLPTNNRNAYHRFLITHKGAVNSISSIMNTIAALGTDLCLPC